MTAALSVRPVSQAQRFDVGGNRTWLNTMGHLESTSLRGTKLRSRALEELRLALPHVRIRGDIPPPAQPPDKPALAPLFQQGA